MACLCTYFLFRSSFNCLSVVVIEVRKSEPEFTRIDSDDAKEYITTSKMEHHGVDGTSRCGDKSLLGKN